MSWVICIKPTDAECLAPLRLTRGIEVAEKEPFIWVRGGNSDEELELLIRALPAVARYELSSGNRLRNLESRIPAETLPLLNWQLLGTWLRVQLPGNGVSHSNRWGEKEKSLPPLRPVSLRIVRSTEERPIDLLMTRLSDWRDFALSSPEVRLQQLRFAVDADGNVVVRGKPLPPLPGRQFVLHANIGVQAGFMWEPAVSAEVLVRRLGLSTDALVLFHEGGMFSRIEAEQFVPATRSAVRETIANES
jgi:hypothetical protein